MTEQLANIDRMIVKTNSTLLFLEVLRSQEIIASARAQGEEFFEGEPIHAEELRLAVKRNDYLQHCLAHDIDPLI